MSSFDLYASAPSRRVLPLVLGMMLVACDFPRDPLWYRVTCPGQDPFEMYYDRSHGGYWTAEGKRVILPDTCLLIQK